MRWLFLLLLLANGFYYLWHQTTQGPVQPETAHRGEGVASLTLLSELEPEPVLPAPVPETEPAAADTGAAVAAEVQPPALSCWRLGPVVEERSARALAQALQERGLETEVNTQQMPDEPDYWVYIGPFFSQSEGLAAVRELQARKVDSYLVVSGELANSVSLGLFSELTRAERLRKQRSGLGYEVKIHSRERSRPAFSVLARGAVDEAAFAAELSAATRAAGLAQIQKNSCN